MNRYLLSLTAVMAVIALSCGRGPQEKKGSDTTPAVTVIDKGFSKYISAYTSGVVPAGSTLQIVFTPEFAAAADKTKTQGLFSFSPALKGTTEWADDITLLFKPSKPLEPATSYQGTLDLSKIGSVEEQLRLFPLAFSTVEKNFTVTLNPVTCDLPDGNTYSLTGTLVTSDFVDPSEVEKYLTASTGRRSEKITWDHDNNNNHLFTIEKIQRGKEESLLTVAWNGNQFGIKNKGDQSVAIPAEGVFTVTEVKVNAGDSKSIEVFFSDLLNTDSELEGVVTMRPDHPLTVSAEGNKLLIIPGDNVVGVTELTVDGSLRNNRGRETRRIRHQEHQLHTGGARTEICRKGCHHALVRQPDISLHGRKPERR